ncbi:hypothetical protein V5799_015073 [Amblyomma americanum]|uniref:Uncharacterized protein n=1 Tax=Amblyomma americanum TaxID=6943 RepID=A0AAQ4E172_AMBAM
MKPLQKYQHAWTCPVSPWKNVNDTEKSFNNVVNLHYLSFLSLYLLLVGQNIVGYRKGTYRLPNNQKTGMIYPKKWYTSPVQII